MQYFEERLDPALRAPTASPWRIVNSPRIPRVLSFLLRCGYARSRDPFHPSHHDPRPTCRSRRRPFRSAESVLVKHQLLILHRSPQRAPNLRLSDRIVAGCCALFVRPSRLIRSAIVLRPSTLLSLHQALRNRKYRRLFSSQRGGKPGPKGPNQELIEAVVQMRQRNPAWGCPRIAQQIAWAFDIILGFGVHVTRPQKCSNY